MTSVNAGALLPEERIDWPGGAKIALSIVVNVEEGSEMTVARGDKGMEPVDELGIHLKGPLRNYSNESNYLYGLKAGAPRIVKLLREHGVMASWTVAAMSLENHPEIARAIVELGHEAVSHGWRWVHQFRMNEEQEGEFIDKAVKSIERSVGVRPQGWLSRYLHTDNTRRLLIERGFQYHMDDYSGDVPFWDRETVPGRSIVILPYQLDTNDMKMWTDPAMTPTQWLEYARNCFDQLYREGEAGNPKMMSLGLHLRIIGRPGRIWALEAFLDHVSRHPDVWIASRGEIARHFASVCTS
jgi:allantoinase